MENNKNNNNNNNNNNKNNVVGHGSGSSLDHLFGPRDSPSASASSSSSSAGLFNSIFPPPSTVLGRERKRDLGNQFGSGKYEKSVLPSTMVARKIILPGRLGPLNRNIFSIMMEVKMIQMEIIQTVLQEEIGGRQFRETGTLLSCAAAQGLSLSTNADGFFPHTPVAPSTPSIPHMPWITRKRRHITRVLFLEANSTFS
ncbi:hypothetical protein TIFTF001_010622 [Ficus carica]|uniref:Uncharacterized protein n=1 Tax=Ficus carica TaxID=3494 RepID=A0AA88D3J1_FICCA|nr:hypothetical protein TIFTF001_010622 [Ficus carica]